MFDFLTKNTCVPPPGTFTGFLRSLHDPRREEVENAAPDGELAHPVHLRAAGIPGGGKAGDQRLHIGDPVLIRAGADRKGRLPQRLRPDCPGRRRLSRRDRHRQLPLQNAGEDAQPLLLVLARDALHLPVAVIPGGEDGGEILFPCHRV